MTQVTQSIFYKYYNLSKLWIAILYTYNLGNIAHQLHLNFFLKSLMPWKKICGGVNISITKTRGLFSVGGHHALIQAAANSQQECFLLINTLTYSGGGCVLPVGPMSGRTVWRITEFHSVMWSLCGWGWWRVQNLKGKNNQITEIRKVYPRQRLLDFLSASFHSSVLIPFHYTSSTILLFHRINLKQHFKTVALQYPRQNFVMTKVVKRKSIIYKLLA